MKEKILIPTSNPVTALSDEELIRLLLLDRACRDSTESHKRSTTMQLDYFLHCLVEGEQEESTIHVPWSNESLSSLYLSGITQSPFHYFLYVESRDRVEKLPFKCVQDIES